MQPFIEALDDARGTTDAAWMFPPSDNAGNAIPADFGPWAVEIVDSVCESRGIVVDFSDKWKAVELVEEILIRLENSGYDDEAEDDFWKGLGIISLSPQQYCGMI